MGLLTIIRKQKIKDHSLRILILGLDNAGKTTIVKSLLGEDISTVSPTLGFNIKTLSFGAFRLDLWDVGGQVSLRSYWRNYFESTDGLVWVVDSTDRARLEDCRLELFKLLQEERLQGADLLLLANKSDVVGCMTTEDIVTALRLAEIRTHHWAIYDVSAVTGQNVKSGFEFIVQSASKRTLS